MKNPGMDHRSSAAKSSADCGIPNNGTRVCSPVRVNDLQVRT